MPEVQAVTAESALDVRCPVCKAGRTSPCFYTPIKKPTYQDSKAWARFNKTGMPTKVPHSRRFDHMRIKVANMRRNAMLAEATKPTPALIAMRAFDVAEYTALKSWLHLYGPILWQT